MERGDDSRLRLPGNHSLGLIGGFLAFWKAADTNPQLLTGVIAVLRELQRAGSPDFRLVLHRGDVIGGGGGPLGEESLSGPAVNFVFRMEKLAGTLGERCVFSGSAAISLNPVIACKLIGDHPLLGVKHSFAFFGAKA